MNFVFCLFPGGPGCITHMEQWDQDFVDLVTTIHVTIRKDGTGGFRFGAVLGKWTAGSRTPEAVPCWGSRGTDRTNAILLPFFHFGDDSAKRRLTLNSNVVHPLLKNAGKLRGRHSIPLRQHVDHDRTVPCACLRIRRQPGKQGSPVRIHDIREPAWPGRGRPQVWTAFTGSQGSCFIFQGRSSS